MSKGIVLVVGEDGIEKVFHDPAGFLCGRLGKIGHALYLLGPGAAASDGSQHCPP